jgi:hypothetical protein
MGRVVTLGVAGAGKVSQALVFDTLNDQFSVGAEDAEGYFAASEEYEISLVLPATEAAATEGVGTVCEWAVRCELPYVVYSDGFENDATLFMARNVHDPAADVLPVLADDVYKAMLACLCGSENPMLVLLLGEEGFGEDAALEALAAGALAEDIPVFDLARAFLEVTWADLPHHEQPEVQLVTEADGQVAYPVSALDGERIELSPAQLQTLRQTFAELQEALDRIVFAHQVVAPARRALIAAQEALIPPPPPAEKGRRRRLEIKDPDTGEWVPAGRGRPKQGVERRYVDVGRGAS